MTWRGAAAIAAAVVTALTLATVVLFIATPIHDLLFRIVPADGPVSASDRSEMDSKTVAYLVTGDQTQLAGYSADEQLHLADVRGRLGLIVLVTVLGIIATAALRPTKREWRWASWVSFAVTLLVAITFEPAFILMHQVLFPAGDWELPSSQFVITQVYPIGFFIGAWLGIGVLAWGALVLFSWRMRYTQN